MNRRGTRPDGSGRAGRLMRLAVVLLALAMAFGGAALWQYRNGEAAAQPALSAAMGGLDVTAGEARWAATDAHTMDGPQGGGYQMPAQVMPGAPEDGTMRLGIALTIADRGDEARLLDLDREFTHRGRRPRPGEAARPSPAEGVAAPAAKPARTRPLRPPACLAQETDRPRTRPSKASAQDAAVEPLESHQRRQDPPLPGDDGPEADRPPRQGPQDRP
ncbi:hypothetical protein [Kitasatospora sp. NPDC093102]|uniref:hypothetical protein n=1 Tax=Kitasatospora sp. NPDC093102 TaxID=3155069 RepID=UPI00344524CA